MAVTPPASIPIEDELANDELYQQFVNRESSATSPVAVPGTPSSEGGSVAPSTPSEEPGDDEGAGGDDTPDPDAEPVVTEGEGDGEGEGDEADPNAEVTPPIDDTSFTYLDRTFTAPEMQRVFEVADWAAQLTPDQAALIDGVLSGQYQVVPRDQSFASPPAGVPTPTGTPAGTSPDLPELDDELIDPALKAHLDYLRTQVESFTATTQQQQLDQQRQSLETFEAAASQARTTFATDFNLSDDEVSAIEQRTVQLQIIPGFANQYRGNPALAIQKAFETVYWATPDYQAREVERRLEEERAASTTTTNRKGKASALTGNGGSVPRTPANPAPLTQVERRAAMAKAIAEGTE